MSKISDLIAKLCPNGVEYKKLGEIAHYSANRVDASCVNAKTYVGVESLLAEKQGKVDSTCVPSAGRLIEFLSGDVLIGNIRPYLKKIWLADCDGGTNGDVLVVQINDRAVLMSEYLYYVLSSDSFFLYDMQFAKGAKMPRGDKESILGYPIPVPPLEVQREVVEVLDKFALLTAELTAELEKRKKQYEHYRDTTIDRVVGDVNWLALGDVADVTKLAGFEFTKYVRYQDRGEIIALRGLNVKHGNLNLDDVKYIDGSDFKMLERSRLKTGDMLFTYVGTVGQVALVDLDDKYYLAPNVSRIRFDKSRLNPEFMKYYFQTSRFLKGEMKKYMGSSSMDNLTMGNIRKFKIPLPPLAEQERIVAILDRFDALVNSLTSGLPAEIAARKKQYEYYRDKLLNFPPSPGLRRTSKQEEAA